MISGNLAVDRQVEAVSIRPYLPFNLSTRCPIKPASAITIQIAPTINDPTMIHNKVLIPRVISEPTAENSTAARTIIIRRKIVIPTIITYPCDY